MYVLFITSLTNLLIYNNIIDFYTSINFISMKSLIKAINNPYNTIKKFLNYYYRSRSLGSAALSLCYLAMGAVDICSFIKLKCWDVAAGILIIQEAGGIVLDSNGNINK